MPTRILLVKMSSMGDILHTFPAITELNARYPDATIDWVVEAGFADMAGWHPGVSRVIPIRLRHWLRQKNRQALSEWKAWRTDLRRNRYDVVIDAQGLIKSSLVASQANAPRHQRHGFGISAAREPAAAWLYGNRHRVSGDLHAVARTRALFGAVMGYEPSGEPEFGVRQQFVDTPEANDAPIVIIPGTTWHTKHWHPEHWQKLCRELVAEGESIEVVWGSPAEQAMAGQIVDIVPNVHTAKDRLSIPEVTQKLAAAKAVIGMDTGFTHIAGALGTPSVAIYGPTSPRKVGLIGSHTHNATMDLSCAPCHKRTCKWLPEDTRKAPPCMRDLTPEVVMQAVRRLV